MMEANTTDIYIFSSEAGMFAQKTAAEKAAEIFTKPIEVMSTIVCILGLIANIFSITATAHIPRGQSTHSKLIISLGVSDSLILAAIMLHNLMYIFSSWDDCIKMMKRLLLDMALLATLINLLVMAVDHYLAIVKPLHYRRFLSKMRGNCLIIFIWVFSITTGLVEMLVGLSKQAKTQQSLCTVISEDEFDLEYIIIGVIFVVLLVIIVIYTRIYVLVKRLMERDRMMYQDEMHGYKAIVTTMLIIGTFTLFWAPDGIFQVYMYMKIKSDRLYVLQHLNEFSLINDILFLILQFNSFADPLIYAIRLRDVQRGYRAVFYKLFPNYRYSINEEEFRQHHMSFTSCRRNTNPTIIQDGVISPDSFHDNLHEKRSCESSFLSDKYQDETKTYEVSDDTELNEETIKESKVNGSHDNKTHVQLNKMGNGKIANNNTENMHLEDTAFGYNHINSKETDGATLVKETDPLNPE